MTFSITARCPETGMFGVAVTSSSMAVAARCAFARAGVGAVASQNITDPRLGPRGLDLMAGSKSAAAALDTLLGEHAHRDYRQLVLVDGTGGVAHHSGVHTLGTHAVAAGEAAVAAGNLLANPNVPAAMIEAFQESAAPFPERLVCALQGGLAAGGEAAGGPPGGLAPGRLARRLDGGGPHRRTRRHLAGLGAPDGRLRDSGPRSLAGAVLRRAGRSIGAAGRGA
jgi:uncharacterized Ntn-hydrolase superfamily protein